MRVLVLGWSSVTHGEATAGDVLAMQAVTGRLRERGVAVDVAWSAVMARPGQLRLEAADPAAYTHVVWVCGPLRGVPIREVHDRFAASCRVAVGVSVLAWDDDEVAGFDAVIPRDGPDLVGGRDLAARPRPPLPPVVGVILAGGQAEYGPRRRHDEVNQRVGQWLRGVDAATLVLDTRLDPRDWRLPGTAGQVEAVLARLDVLVTTRLHGLVLALKRGVPAVAIDPVRGGAKVTAQARAWEWPVLDAAAGTTELDDALAWCVSEPGRRAATRAAGAAGRSGGAQLDRLMTALGQAGV